MLYVDDDGDSMCRVSGWMVMSARCIQLDMCLPCGQGEKLPMTDVWIASEHTDALPLLIAWPE